MAGLDVLRLIVGLPTVESAEELLNAVRFDLHFASTQDLFEHLRHFLRVATRELMIAAVLR